MEHQPKPQIPIESVPEGVTLIRDVPAPMYGGQLRPTRAWVIPDAQRVVFSMVDEQGRMYLLNFDRDQLKAVVNAGERLFENAQI